MVDLQSQYQRIKQDIDAGIQEVIDSAAFIKGPKVAAFQEHLEAYTGAKHVINVGNGTDALQIALMGLGLQPGDEVITFAPFFGEYRNYVRNFDGVLVTAATDPEAFLPVPEILASVITTIAVKLGVSTSVFSPLKELSKFLIIMAMAAIGFYLLDTTVGVKIFNRLD